MRYLAHTKAEITSMLNTIGKSTLAELFSSIPTSSVLKQPLGIPTGAKEMELTKALKERAGHAPRLQFLGAGVTPHFVPQMVSQMLLRSEWYTAYTPYQPEASQGTLQAIFEFQSIVANLFGCDVANASMYDGATATSEALLMALRLKPAKKRVLISSAVHPEYRQVCATHLKAAGFLWDEIAFDENGCTNFKELTAQLGKKDIAAVLFQTPNFFGQLESQRELIDLAHANDALAVATTAEPVAFGVVESPGTLGADIVCGEGIGLCGHSHLGAPGVGLFATRQEFLRQMPGRLCGATVDADGKTGFVLTLSTREQHIRREKATSNICTNHNLMALAFTITASLYGKTGFANLSEHNLKTTLYLRQKLKEAGLQSAFSGPHFNETVVALGSEDKCREILSSLETKDIFGGVLLSTWYPALKGHLLVCTTELHRPHDVDLLVSHLSGGR